MPNTDEARIRSLRTVVEKEAGKNVCDLILSPKLLNEIISFLPNFEQIKKRYVEALALQVNSNARFQQVGRNARLYISHFIQVLNLCVIRKEIKGNVKVSFGLDPENYTVPDLSSDADVLLWGEQVLNGENERICNGGVPIYNPTIAKVRVYYDMFKEAYHNQKYLQRNTTHTLGELSSLRDRADIIIRDAWNEIEVKFDIYPVDEKLNYCREYGVVYYYRKNEKEKI